MDRARIVAAAAMLAAVAFLHGCVSTSFRPEPRATTAALAPVPPSSVSVFRSRPDSEFLALGEITAYVSGFLSDDAILRALRRKAASLGANAIVIVKTGTSENYAWPEDFFGRPSKTSAVLVTAIRVPTEPLRPSSR